uniref:DUF3456 domain-containing protein n=1 Tax=Graphocephala atropunctata TaxID=36148 RepID=A0A1B6KXQ4_9HEMI
MSTMSYLSVKSVKVFIVLLLLIPGSLMVGIDRKHVKCLVCQRLVQEMYKAVEKVSPSLKYYKRGYTLDEHKDSEFSIEMRRSEVFLDEVMDKLCTKMNDYARGFHIDTGKLAVIPLVIGKAMNPYMQEYKMVQDGDLESLEFYCQSILSEHGDELMSLFKSEAEDIESDLCFNTELCAGYEREYDPSTNLKLPLFDEL